MAAAHADLPIGVLDSRLVVGQSERVRLTQWRYHCGDFYELANADTSFMHGTFLAHSRSGEVAVVAVFDAVSDPCFDEVRLLIEEDPRLASMTASARVALLHEVLSVTFDPDDGGNAFELDQTPGCPHCGSRSVGSFTETDEPVTIQPVSATHIWWNAQTPIDRSVRVRELLDQLLDGA